MKPNSTELTILKLLWKKEPRTGSDIHAALQVKLGWSYSSTRKTLERMADKGLIAEARQGNRKIYTAILAKLPTLALLARDFAKQVMELDEPLPVAMFSDSKLISHEEMSELEAVLAELSEPNEHHSDIDNLPEDNGDKEKASSDKGVKG